MDREKLKENSCYGMIRWQSIFRCFYSAFLKPACILKSENTVVEREEQKVYSEVYSSKDPLCLDSIFTSTQSLLRYSF